MGLTPRRHGPDDPALAAILDLIRTCFAPMEGRIDPPSSMLRMTLTGLQQEAATSEIWSLGTPSLSCVILTPRPQALYLGKLAVHPAARRQGHARRLLDHAEARARSLRLPAVELQSRVELVENHALFAAAGYAEIARTAHPGYAQPTSITFRKTTGG
ncbi:acetyltransferase [Sulfitobacter sp. EhC04]|uniref:GNAT family N-acetyltransferase n=1 Tax=Sulfitobacter sp. EhC04 TaxID=1849168 RepID=UPI0007F4836B|nr:GNAT family N-acetyltransferase [Sulfitobacter sp. EhC04]OAN69978.1 acetyltransferase [Sulfitobacter sp. EhC04]